LFFKIGADAQKRSAVKNGGYIGKKMLKLQSMLDAALLMAIKSPKFKLKKFAAIVMHEAGQ
jgi:hypothetical protein